MSFFSNTLMHRTVFSASALALISGVASADQVFLDDVIVDGSLCVGFDCVNGESFGSDTIRLKENNLRIHFDDTSTASSFPNNDWRLSANASSNGGSNRFAIEDATANRTLFSLQAGAPTNSLIVDSQGDIGIKTGVPITDLHITEGDTPTVRLEQDGSSGFAAQTYDVASNEANFFIRDVTNGSSLFFRARPGAPSNSIFIQDNGDVGFGTAGPSASLHALDADGSGPLQMLRMENNGAVQLFMNNTDRADAQWMFSAGASMLLVPDEDPANAVFDLDASGNLDIDGALTQSSDRRAKTNIVPVDPADILAKVEALPVAHWTYTHDAQDGIRHIGPMAQDFYAAFGTGQDETGISTLDSSGVALAAIQALSQRVAELEQQLQDQ